MHGAVTEFAKPSQRSEVCVVNNLQFMQQRQLYGVREVACPPDDLRTTFALFFDQNVYHQLNQSVRHHYTCPGVSFERFELAENLREDVIWEQVGELWLWPGRIIRHKFARPGRINAGF